MGTYGAVKGMSPADLEAVGARIILGNTFHLWLRPGGHLVMNFVTLENLATALETLKALAGDAGKTAADAEETSADAERTR